MENVLILGTGPAGLTAALYTARANLSPLVYEGIEPGGQLTTTTEVENYPGFAEGVDGTLLVNTMREQAQRFGARFKRGRAAGVDFSQRPFKVFFADALDKSRDAKIIGEVETKTVIIATGAAAKYLGVPGEARLMNRGVSACAVCDGALPIFRNAVLAVAGGGDSAVEESTFLTKFAGKVYVIHRRNELRASKIMQERMFANPKIEVIWDTVVEEVLGEDKVSALKLRNAKNGETRELPVGGFFLGIGHTPNTGFLNGQLETDENGFIKVKSPRTYTSVEGVFACGDVADPIYKQAVTAAGTGCAAALDAERFLEEH